MSEQRETGYVVVGEWRCEHVGGCTCGAGEGVYGHESGCGLEPIARVTDLLAALAPTAPEVEEGER